MSETTTEDKEALERRNRGRLATAVAVAVLCLLGIVVVQQVRRFFNGIVRRTEEPLRLSAAPPVGAGGPEGLAAFGRTRTLNVAACCAPVSNISAGQQRNGLVAGARHSLRICWLPLNGGLFGLHGTAEKDMAARLRELAMRLPWTSEAGPGQRAGRRWPGRPRLSGRSRAYQPW